MLPKRLLYFLAPAFFLLQNSSYAQLKDLCGMWLAKSYQCYTVNPGGALSFYYTDEVVLITHNGSLTTATKLTGDPCVMAGQQTWQGNYTSNPFGISLTMGAPGSPGNSQIGTTVDVKDSAHLEIGSLKFTRLSCKQIDSLQIPLDSVNNRCSKCEVKKKAELQELIPNVFTPNKDGINDYFLPQVPGILRSSALTVYDRWGNSVFKSTELYKAWDGQSAGIPCSDGIYFWVYTYTDDTQHSHTLKGFVTLFK